MHREIFDDLARAKESCKKDRNCRGVWDFWCNGTYLQKCEIGKPYSDDFEFGSACVYDKKGIQNIFIRQLIRKLELFCF